MVSRVKPQRGMDFVPLPYTKILCDLMSSSIDCFTSGVMTGCSSDGGCGRDFDGVQTAVFERFAERGVDETISVEQRHSGKRAGHHAQIIVVERSGAVVCLNDGVRQLYPDERLDFRMGDHRALISLKREFSLADN